MIIDEFLLNSLIATTLLASQLQEPQQFLHIASHSFAIAPEALLAQGRIIGTNIKREGFPQAVDVFLGIPYAKPPIGPRGRFFPAEPVDNSSEAIVYATDWGARCPGKALADLGPPLEADEDCLTVNVFRPRDEVRSKGARAKLLPVAVWVHGGAFNKGSSSQLNIDSMVAFPDSPFIGISFNYR